MKARGDGCHYFDNNNLILATGLHVSSRGNASTIQDSIYPPRLVLSLLGISGRRSSCSTKELGLVLVGS